MSQTPKAAHVCNSDVDLAKLRRPYANLMWLSSAPPNMRMAPLASYTTKSLTDILVRVQLAALEAHIQTNTPVAPLTIDNYLHEPKHLRLVAHTR